MLWAKVPPPSDASRKPDEPSTASKESKPFIPDPAPAIRSNPYRSPSTSTDQQPESRPSPPVLLTSFSPFTFLSSILTPSSILLTVSTLLTLHIYRTRLKRYPNYATLPPRVFLPNAPRLYGYVTRVGDGDNFRFFHTPGGRLLGWGWLRKLPPIKGSLEEKQIRLRGGKVVNVGDNTLHVRLAGIDAPECAHWGKEAQFHGEESKEWLRSRLEGRFVKVKLLRRDQYERVVGRTWVRKWWGGWGDLGLEMVQRGMACVYEGTYGVEFGGMEGKYRSAEEEAKNLRVGMWKHGGRFSGESPAELKRKYKELTEAKGSYFSGNAVSVAPKTQILKKVMEQAAKKVVCGPEPVIKKKTTTATTTTTTTTTTATRQKSIRAGK